MIFGYSLTTSVQTQDIVQLLDDRAVSRINAAASVGKPSTAVLYGLTMAVFVYGWLSVNIYLPIFPELEARLHTTRPLASLTVTVFLIGFSFTQLVW